MSRETKKKEGSEAARTGTTDPADRRLAEWIARQWRHDEQPTRIEAYRMSKVKRMWVREGVAAYSRTFKPSEKMDIDIAGKLSNDVMGDCQAHCDAHPSKAPGPVTYIICIGDPGRSANARNEVVERPIILYPQRVIFQPTEATATSTSNDEDGEEDDDGTANAALRKTLKVMSEREEWRVETENTVVGDVVKMATEQWREIHKAYMDLTKSHVELLHKTRELDIIDKDHEPDRVYAMAKATLAKEGVSALSEGVKVIKYLVMGAKPNGETKALGPGLTKLQTIVHEFLDDCEREKVDEILFGEVKDAAMLSSNQPGYDPKTARLVKAGIFSEAQVRLLAAVSEGRLPDADLEKLLPDSGDVLSITPKQYTDAHPVLEKAGLSDAIKIVFGFCIKARKARMERKSNATTQ